MNKTKIGIFLSLMLVLGFCSSCGEKESNSKLLLNEVLITNESNFQEITVFTAHGLRYSTNHMAAPTLQVAI